MDKVKSVGQGFPRSSGQGSATCNFSSTGLRASAVAQQLMSKTLISLSKFCILVSFATTHLSTMSNGNFTVQGTSYNWSSDVIFLGGAYSITEVERLSLLANGAPGFQCGLAYFKDPVRMKDPVTGLSASFNTSFAVDKVFVVDNVGNGDGFTFVVSADNSTIGGYGERLGIFDLYKATTAFKSIVVEFDGFMNLEVNDISDNHVSFDFAQNNWTAATNASNVNVLVWDNKTLFAWVEYSNITQQLEARISNENSRPISPLLNYTVDLFNVVEEYMWMGFSAGTGTEQTAYFVSDWSFESYGILPPRPRGSGPDRPGLLIGISVGVPSLLLACIFIVLLVYRMYGGKRAYRYCELAWTVSREEFQTSIELEGMPERFRYKQLAAATENFSKESKLGQGGFGSVYRGMLPSGTTIAVKKISADSTQGQKEFVAEVSIISRVRHRNLIQLTGWCEDASKGKFLLVYELMPNGSLDKALFGQVEKGTPSLSWSQRFHIVKGTAAGLDYLHQGWTQQVIHRDVKSSNIMLDERWNAKLGDFGLARLVDHEGAGATTVLAGTRGYIAPELAVYGKYTDKSDVYAFGAVLLEVACGRAAFSPRLAEAEMFLVDRVWRKLSEGDLLSMVDERLQVYDTHWIQVMLKMGLLCSHPNPLARPTMRQVVQVLTGEVPMPSIPYTKPAVLYSDLRRVFKVLTGEAPMPSIPDTKPTDLYSDLC